MDSSYLQTPVSAGQTEEIDNAGDIPESFDAREKWSYCKSISLIRDQSKCGSCWAVSAASAMSDRLCIQTGGKNQTLISDSDILSCCNDWSPTCSRGCRGARDNLAAWEYVKERGSCSGGAYEEKGVCKPYPFYPCGPLLTTACPEEPFTAPECKKECQSGDKDEYERSRIYGKGAYIGV
ncbi:papain family cysteine protease [Oesophagostomum dentatum]|uniref:Papain family cysteine protease n=1 Tax=Oesophagostomum dentatum TaxID=61180 RepID=A0A0B1SE61_OESDE|nr:papain family cysteine protease [Oesophagostomum dentatum]